MTFKTEFPDFDAATMPAIPAGFEDVSWKNDACPSFLNEAAGLIIFVDFANPSDREFDDGKRFNVNVWDGGNTGETVAESDSWQDIETAIAARTKPAPRNADYAREVIAEMERDTKSKAARKALASAAIRIGNYTDEARDVWRDYLKTLES